jgi:hypothetical protein
MDYSGRGKWKLTRNNMNDMYENQRAQPKTFTMQMREGASHLIVTVPSTSLSQKQEPEMLSPQSAFCIMIQLAMNLKFLLTAVMLFKI